MKSLWNCHHLKVFSELARASTTEAFGHINVVFCYWVRGWKSVTFLFAALYISVLFHPLNCVLTLLKRSPKLLVHLLKSKNWHVKLSPLPEVTSTSFTSAGTGKEHPGGWERAGEGWENSPGAVPAALWHLKELLSCINVAPRSPARGTAADSDQLAKTSQLSLQHQGRALTALQRRSGSEDAQWLLFKGKPQNTLSLVCYWIISPHFLYSHCCRLWKALEFHLLQHMAGRAIEMVFPNIPAWEEAPRVSCESLVQASGQERKQKKN